MRPYEQQLVDNELFFARSREEWREMGGFPVTSEVGVLDALALGRLRDEIDEERERWLQAEFEKDLRASGRL